MSVRVCLWSASIALLCGCLLPRPSLDAVIAAMPPHARGIAACRLPDGLRLVEAARRPSRAANSRKVQIQGGEREVSVVDGYRLMFAYPGTDYFANVKLERSMPNRFAADRDTILDQFEFLAGQSPDIELARGERSGVFVYALDNAVLGDAALDHAVVGTFVMFLDEETSVLTIYLLNQKAERRHFRTIDEYRRLRDNFLNHLASCAIALPDS